MREIKFRAWDKKKNRFVNNYVFSPAGGNPLSFDEGDCEDHLRGHAELTNLIISQYTGLKDKNGKEIYEGDIIEIFGNKEEVKWFAQHTGFMPFIGGMERNDKDCEVVGNIFENPELLQQANS